MVRSQRLDAAQELILGLFRFDKKLGKFYLRSSGGLTPRTLEVLMQQVGEPRHLSSPRD